MQEKSTNRFNAMSTIETMYGDFLHQKIWDTRMTIQTMMEQEHRIKIERTVFCVIMMFLIFTFGIGW